MNLKNIIKEHKLIDLFVQLCEIPSPSLKENELSSYIMDIMKIHGIKSGFDKYGNIMAKIPPTSECKNVPPILLSAHMDVIGGTDRVNIKLSANKKYIETDKTRTLGADNKAGVAAILDLAIKLNNLGSKIEHGPIEITFTRDEEKGMTGIRNLDTSKLNSKYAIIADGERLGELDVEGAGFTNVFISASEGKGGHSGINISDKTRVNALKVISEIDSKIPQGVYKENEKGVITSINAAAGIGGTTFDYVSEIIKEIYQLGKNKKKLDEKYDLANILDVISRESMLNVIASNARMSYSIRSSEPESEKELINHIKQVVKDTDNRHRGFVKCEVEVQCHLKPFIKSDDDTLVNIILDAASENNIESKPSSFHAGAETHVLANEKLNAKGEKFAPVIMGIANLRNIHSSDEMIDWRSYLEGRKWLEDTVIKFAERHKESVVE